MKACVYLLLTTIASVLAARVRWLPNKSFSLPINYKDGKLPCSKQTVVFPETTYENVVIDSSLSVSGMVLPKEGAVELTSNAEITFGATASDNCTDDGDVYFMPKATASWGQPDVWESPRFNKATPDAERVPCFDDTVVFPSNVQFTVILPDKTQYIRELVLFDEFHFKAGDSFEIYVRYAIAKYETTMFVLNEHEDIGVVIEEKACQSQAGCPCQKNVLDLDCSVKFCPVAKCLYPIKPIGHCCKICGGYFTMDIDESFDMMEFQAKVAEIVQSYGENDLVYHIGRLPGNKVQLVVMDKTEYVGTSAQVVLEVEYAIGNGKVNIKADYSGSPLSKGELGANIAISVFFLVIFVISAMFVYYYKMPQIRYPTLIGRRATWGGVSTFNRRTESVVSLTRRDSGFLLGSGSAGFRNPLYDSKRSKVQVEETVVEE